MKLRRPVLVSAFAGTAAVVFASSAWAWCTPYVDQSTTVAAGPNRAPAGADVKASGTNWHRGEVEIRWGSPTGIKLGTATVRDAGSGFSVLVTIPDDAPVGANSLFFVHGPSQLSTPFEVTSAVATAPDDAGTPASGPTQASASARTAVAPPASEPAAPSQGAPSQAAPSQAAPSQPAPSQPAPSGTGPSSPGSSIGPGAPAQVALAVPTAVATQRTGSARPVAVGPLAAKGSIPVAPAGPPAAAEAEQPVAAATGPSVRTAADDLWSGFAEGADSAAPSLVDLSTDQATSSATVAAGLVVAGLLALFAGFALTEVAGRRRVVAISSR